MQFSQFKSRWELPIIAMIFLAVFAMSLSYADFLITRAKIANVFSAWQPGKVVVAEHFAWHGTFPTTDMPTNENTKIEEMYQIKIVDGIAYGSVTVAPLKKFRFDLFDIWSWEPREVDKNESSPVLTSYTFPMYPGTVKTEVSPTLVWACGTSLMPTNVHSAKPMPINHGIELLPHVCRRNNEGKDHAN